MNFLNSLKWHAQDRGQGRHIFINPRKKIIKEVLHSNLIKLAFGLSYWLAEKNIIKGDVCYIVASDHYSQLVFFYAVIAAGALPMIGSQSAKFGAAAEMIDKIKYWKSLYGHRLKVISEKDLDVAALIVPDLQSISYAQKPLHNDEAKEDDIVYLQSSSATTGNPKAISISNKNILINVQQIKNGLQSDVKEIFVSWLPLYHDMGLVGAEIFSLRYDYDLVLIPPFEFTRQPEIWLEAISKYRGTITAIPSFAIDYLLDRDCHQESPAIDISSLHSICIGAEPVRIQSIEKFLKLYKSVGIKENAFVPCYGLAESTLAASFKPAGELPNSLYIKQSSVTQGKKIRLAKLCNKRAIRVTSVGKLVEGVVCNIKHENIYYTEELFCGEICLSGPSITQGYMKAKNIISLLPNNILSTGDIGFIYEDELYILDRDKNIIILNGVNYIASEIESKIAEQLKIEKRNVIVFEADISNEKKKIVALIEVKNINFLPAATDKTFEKIYSSSIVDEIRLVKRGFIERTSSGKKKYFRARLKFNKEEMAAINGKISEVRVVA